MFHIYQHQRPGPGRVNQPCFQVGCDGEREKWEEARLEREAEAKQEGSKPPVPPTKVGTFLVGPKENQKVQYTVPLSQAMHLNIPKKNYCKII